MNWGERKVNKSPEEVAFDEAREAYQLHFGEAYVIDFADEPKTFGEAVEEINRMIADNKKQTADKYEPGVLY